MFNIQFGVMSRPAGGVGGLLFHEEWSSGSSRTIAYGYDGNDNITTTLELDTGAITGQSDYDPFGNTYVLQQEP